MKIDGGLLTVAIVTDSIANLFVASSKDVLTPDAWTHVGYSIDTSRKNLQIFINGILSNVAELPLLLWCPKVINDSTTQIIETNHPYADDMRQYWHIKVPNAFKYSVVFDSQSVTEDGCDYVRFYKGTSRSTVIGDDKYTGRKWAGLNSIPPLEITDSEFDIFFYSDGSRTDWGFKAYVTATVKSAGQGGEEVHADVNSHPFFIGQAPGYATSERAATCAISQVFVAKETFNVDKMRQVAFKTTHYSSSPVCLEYHENLSMVRCPFKSMLPVNAYAYLPAMKSIFTAVVNELGPDSNSFGFSIGLVLKSSISMRDKNDFVLVGKDAVSYGIFFDGFGFDIGYSRTPKRSASTKSPKRRNSYSAVSSDGPSIFNRPLSSGDKVTLITDLKTSMLEVIVAGPSLKVSKKFGLSADLKDTSAYILCVSLGSGQSIQLTESSIGDAGPSVDVDDEEEDEQQEVIPQGPFVVGSRVKIRSVPPEVAEAAMQDRGGWASGMAVCLGNYGTITENSREGVWRIRMETSSDNYVWHEDLLEMAAPLRAVNPPLTPSGGCDATCSQSHSNDGDCLVCGKGWGTHSGHSCSGGGARGSWRVAGATGGGGAAAPSAGPVINGSKVILAPDYARYADAEGGPLRPGNVGTVVADDGSSKPFKVEFEGKTWWYERGALAVYVPPSETAASISTTADTAKKRAAVMHFDIGFKTMDRPMTASAIDSLDAAESIGIIGAICRVSHISLKTQGFSGMQRLLSHDILSPFIRLSFMADSVSIRSAATKAVSLLLPYSSPAAALTSLKVVFPNATSFVEFLLTRIGNQLSGSAKFFGVNPLAFTDIYQSLDILTALFSCENSRFSWSKELETVLSKCIERANVAVNASQIVPETDTLLGLLTLFENNQRLARVSPGNIICVKESVDSILEKYVVLTYSKEGKFEDYFDVSPERSIDKTLSLVRVHKSCIVNCCAYISQDEDRFDLSNQALAKSTLFCLQKMPEAILNLLMNITSSVSHGEERYDTLYTKSIAFGILAAFVAQYSTGSSIDPNTKIDEAFRGICQKWPSFVFSIAESGITAGTPLNTRQPETIEKDSLQLMQMLMNGAREDVSSTEFRRSTKNTSSIVSDLVTVLSESIQTYKFGAVVEAPFKADAKVSAKLIKLFSEKGGADIAMPNNSSDISVISKAKSSVASGKTAPKIRFKCIRGHDMVKFSGTKLPGAPANNVTCYSCSLVGLEVDPEKFHFCKACAASYCMICSRGLNGEVLCADFR